jgi:hypothetical protein
MTAQTNGQQPQRIASRGASTVIGAATMIASFAGKSKNGNVVDMSLPGYGLEPYPSSSNAEMPASAEKVTGSLHIRPSAPDFADWKGPQARLCSGRVGGRRGWFETVGLVYANLDRFGNGLI